MSNELGNVSTPTYIATRFSHIRNASYFTVICLETLHAKVTGKFRVAGSRHDKRCEVKMKDYYYYVVVVVVVVVVV